MTAFILSGPTWAWVLAALVVASLAAGLTTYLTTDSYSSGWPMGLCAFLLVGVLACIPLFIRADHSYEVWCQAQGGHVDTATGSGIGTTVSGSGKVGVGPVVTSTTYCLTDDGRIIDAQ